MSRDDLMAWLNPLFRRGDGTVQSQESAAGQTILAALSLEMIASDGRGYVLAIDHAPRTFLEFADLVHRRLCTSAPDDPDHVLLAAYAWVVANVEKFDGFSWLSVWGRKQLADGINHDLPARDQSDEGRRFNDTKIAPWRAWLNCLGLQQDLPAGGTYPYVAERLSRELSHAGLATNRELSASDVLEVVAQRMPYLDGGHLLNETLRRSGVTPPRRLTRILSVALRDLHDEGRLKMGLRGDSSGAIQLAADPRHRVQTVGSFNLAKATTDA